MSSQKSNFRERNVITEPNSASFEVQEVSKVDACSAIIENYFNRGKDTTKQKDYRRRKNRGTKIDGDENQQLVVKQEHAACDLEKLREWFKIADDFLPEDIIEQNEKVKDGFCKWIRYLSVGFNLLVYGIGSKKTLLDDFCKYIDDYIYIEVDAYHDVVNARTILQSLESAFSLKCVVNDRNPVAYAMAVASSLEKNAEDIIMVINNIDGPGLRESSQQQAFVELAKCPYIHIVASIDHFNAPCLWSREMLAVLNFLWIRASTMHCYKAEILAGESELLKLGSSMSAYGHTSASLEVIWEALTINSRMILGKIVKMFFSRNKPVEFLALYQQAREDFLVTNDTVLRQHLVEFLDHRLIKKQIELNGNEHITVLVKKDVIVPFLQSKGINTEEDDDL